MATGPAKIEIPRWILLVGLPRIPTPAPAVARAVGHQWVRIPRGFSVALVYRTFAAALIVVIVGLATVVVGKTKSAANRVDANSTDAHGQPSVARVEARAAANA